MAATITELLRLPQGPVDLRRIDPHGRPGFKGGKAAGKRALSAMGAPLADLQEKLFAAGYVGATERVLLVLQGMDTSGKGGVINHTVGLLNPSGVHLKSFRKPTEEELEHDFLWRVERDLPGAGQIGIFDRSHYEDVLVARVHRTVDLAEIESRYQAINDFEKRIADAGTTLIKVMLHISAEEQSKRLLARLDNPAKQWKFTPGDVDERAFWDDYQAAFEVALERCNTDQAPWYVVPSDRKWYRNWAVAMLLHETLSRQGLDWPIPDYDLAEQRTRLAATGPGGAGE